MIQKIEQVFWMNPDELIPYENNAKLHPQEQIDRLCNGIKAFGWTQPLVIDKNNVVVIGHGRLMAAKQLLLDKVPCIRRDDLSEEEINACRLEDNKTNESGWDFGKLEEELAQLAIDGIDMGRFGFDDIGVADIPDNLDDDTEKTNVVCSINFPTYAAYEEVKGWLQEISDRQGATLAVKMA